ncbi:hypothetical protein Afer_1449 [Acidimicrobium ferrooxidans DSM 10331]|uniref:Uncharacterized protein n=1 Tax=Acidimicrobium ferrooxidans (strain DSM 10331 / JCM 15462 / NBRC 103882 / ICP) TaxID=525909 RepID=C7M064_ACIFD|nr:hypothetical protein [Acidimicrobium ferrooxidans]ACU54372.1 hypothetical protein Afer_1449 [Acidimicrobium ferrooxidans DSM 10331]
MDRGLESSVASPWRPALIAAIGALLEIAVQVIGVGHGNPGILALVGTLFGSRAHLPAWIPQVRGPGYDGQFFLRLALDPFDIHRRAFGITFDTPYRAQRIGLPFLAWLIAGGQQHLVVWTLPLIEVLAAACIAGSVTVLAGSESRAALTGVAAALYEGYAFSYGRDLAEPVAAALMLLAILSIEHWDRPIVGTVLLLASTLTLETELMAVGALGLVGLARSLRMRRVDHRLIVATAAAISWIGWDAFVSHEVGHVTAAADLNANLGVPLLTQVKAVALHLHPSAADLAWLLQLGLLVLAVAITIPRISRSRAPSVIKVLFIAMIVLALLVGPADWDVESGFRQFDLVWISSLIVIGTTDNPPAWLPALGIAAWIGTVHLAVNTTAFLRRL